MTVQPSFYNCHFQNGTGCELLGCCNTFASAVHEPAHVQLIRNLHGHARLHQELSKPGHIQTICPLCNSCSVPLGMPFHVVTMMLACLKPCNAARYSDEQCVTHKPSRGEQKCDINWTWTTMHSISAHRLQTRKNGCTSLTTGTDNNASAAQLSQPAIMLISNNLA